MMASIPVIAQFALSVLLVLLIYVGTQFWKKQGRARTLDEASQWSSGEIFRRLEGAKSVLGGSLVEGPALQTPKGRLAILATRMPQDPAIDVVKLTLPMSSPFAVTLIPVADQAKALETRTLRTVDLGDPELSARYKVLASDAEFGRRIARPELIGRLEELDRAVGARARLQVAPHGATVLVERDLSEPAQLQAFHDGSVAVVEAFRKLAGG